MDYLRLLVRIRPYLLKHNSPRWVIVLIDLAITTFSIFFAYFLRFGFSFPDNYKKSFALILFLVLFIRTLFFLTFKVFASIVRYTSFLDIRRILLSVSSGTAILLISNYLYNYFIQGTNFIPYSIILMEFLVTIYLMTNLRLLAKHVFLHLNYPDKSFVNVIIYGSRELAVMTKNSLELDTENRFRVVAFIDNIPKLINKKLEGIVIYDQESLTQILEKYEVTYLIFAKKNIKSIEKNNIVKTCYENKIKLLTVPFLSSWINGKLSFKQIRELKIEDLLEREPINLDKKKIKNQLYGKTILVTGAAGSIGSEIVRQVAKFKPEKLILIDQAETPLYDIELELKEKLDCHNSEIILCDIKNKVRIKKIFEIFSPQIVYHAAAYKHVPMMESNPIEAFQNNVLGTKVLADIADEYGVEKFILISTDKAVNPTGIMGATKRIAEMYTQSLNDHSKTSFITTRFGNVLGSNGSVIPRFLKQIEEGGPVTITHPEITRYFMTIQEACQLVLEAGVMGNGGGEIFLFDMGKAVKILDLAKNIIKLSGHMLGKDIEIKITGLRPGEKLFEELLLDAENNKPTYHPKIMVAEVCRNNYDEINAILNKFAIPVNNQDAATVVKLIKDTIPSVKTKPAIFEKYELEQLGSKMVI